MGKKGDDTRSDLEAIDLDAYGLVCFVEDADRAETYRAILEEHDIPVIVQDKEVSGDEGTYAILVPEEHLEEAQELVEMQETSDEYYDLALDEDAVDEDLDDLYDDDY